MESRRKRMISLLLRRCWNQDRSKDQPIREFPRMRVSQCESRTRSLFPPVSTWVSTKIIALASLY